MPNPPIETNRLRTLLTACMILLLVTSGTVMVLGFSPGSLEQIEFHEFTSAPDNFNDGGADVVWDLQENNPDDADFRLLFEGDAITQSSACLDVRFVLGDRDGDNGVAIRIETETSGCNGVDRLRLENVSGGSPSVVDTTSDNTGTLGGTDLDYALDYNAANQSWRATELTTGTETGWHELGGRTPADFGSVHAERAEIIGSTPGWDLETSNQRLRYQSFSGDGANMFIYNYTTFEGNPQAFELVAEDYMRPNSTQPYTVTFTNGTGQHDVTDATNATITSSNDTIVSVDESNNELVATSDENVTGEVTITAEYNFTDEFGELQEFEDSQNVTVAQPTMKNFDILPSAWRINAMFSFDMGSGDQEQDTLPLWIFLTILVGVGLSALSTSFGGIGGMTMMMVVGWVAGYVGDGVMLATVFVGLFIGFNLAANIDYAVRRG